MAEGQYLGEKAKYVYTCDDGETQYVLTLDTTLAMGNSGLASAEAGGGGEAAPKRFVPRTVHWQGTLQGRKVRKKLIAGTINSELYNPNASQAITIDGVAGTTTGKRGE